MRGIEPFHVMEVLARAKVLEAEGRDIVHMEIGEPDFPTPRAVCEAGMRALERGQIYYTPALGEPELRAAIAAHYKTRYGLTVDSSRIVITTGSSGALLLAIAVLVDPGARVLLTDPGYPANRNFVRMMEGVPVNVPVGPGSNYQMTPELLEDYWDDQTVAALVATPSNPTGTLIPREHLAAMARTAEQRGGALIVDEIYHGLVYEGAVDTALSVSKNVFVINSFSKYFHMTGWRLGWIVVPERYVREFDRLSQNIYLSAPTLSQYAALAAFEPATLALLDTRREAFRARRDYLVPALRTLGFDIPQMPQGAFYVYAGCGRLTQDSQCFALELLDKAGVAITPGIDFGDNAPHTHVRFAYTASLKKLRDGVQRIGEYLNTKYAARV
jgi:aspartate/methionine/tyrosine aminotransferase